MAIGEQQPERSGHGCRTVSAGPGISGPGWRGCRPHRVDPPAAARSPTGVVILRSWETLIYRSPIDDQEIPDIPVTECVLRRAGELGDRAALIEGLTGRTYSFAQLRSAIERLAGGLTARGFGPAPPSA